MQNLPTTDSSRDNLPKSRYIHRFEETNEGFCVTQFAHSTIDTESITIGPVARDTYILHIPIHGVLHICGEDIAEGEAFLISKNKPYSFTVALDYSHYWFAFTGKMVSEALEIFDFPVNHHAKLNITDFEYVKDILVSSFDLCFKNKFLRRDIAKSTLLSIFPMLSTDFSDKSTIADDDIQVIAQHIRNNYVYKLNMQELADTIHISEKHLYKKFKKTYGISPQQFLIDTRMKAAEHLLIMTDHKIKEIASNVGYPSQADFLTIFKRKHGMSPQAYRNMNKQHHDS